MGSASSKTKITAQDKAILDIKSQRDKLQQYQKRILKVTEREKQIAAECLEAGNREKALLALRKKKYQEQLIAKTN
ncbi:Charged multivesicular body protein 6, partial [Smittium culicis]